MQKRRWIRVVAERLALVLFGSLLAIGLLEVGLRAASSWVGPRAVDLGPGVGTQRILTLGDSHTYGVFYSQDEAYPGQLQRELDRRQDGRYRVLNLGLPGMNSAEIVARLPEWIETYRPRATVICVGINNVWNQTDVGESPEGGSSEDWRVARLWRLVRLNLGSGLLPQGTGRPEIARVLLDEGREGVEHHDAETGEVLIRHQSNLKERVGIVAAREQLRTDLEALLEIHRREHVEMILLTYSAFPLEGRPPIHQGLALMSDELRDFAARHELELVDTFERFSSLLPPEVPRASYFHNEREGHPNPVGYSEIAKMVAEVIVRVNETNEERVDAHENE